MLCLVEVQLCTSAEIHSAHHDAWHDLFYSKMTTPKQEVNAAHIWLLKKNYVNVQ